MSMTWIRRHPSVECVRRKKRRRRDTMVLHARQETARNPSQSTQDPNIVVVVIVKMSRLEWVHDESKSYRSEHYFIWYSFKYCTIPISYSKQSKCILGGITLLTFTRKPVESFCILRWQPLHPLATASKHQSSDRQGQRASMRGDSSTPLSRG